MSQKRPDTENLRCDAFLGGRLRIWQPTQGYRAGIDAVLLPASVAAKPGESVLDLGCGAGIAGFCLVRRVPGITLVGLERDETFAALARRNAEANEIDAQIIEGDLADMPTALKERQFHHVIANPPYFDRTRGAASETPLREVALGEQTPLRSWVRAAQKRTRPGGSVTFIQRADRLPELLAAFAECLGSLELLPLIPRTGREARLIILRGRPGGKAPFRLHAGRVLHASDTHERDAEDYTVEIADVLRNSGELSFV